METDPHLLSRYHRHGDAGAFQMLVDSHAGMVHATASRVTRDAMLAQDVAQETFLALARSSGVAIQSVGAWLHHVAWQKARDRVRGESRRRSYEAAAAEQMRESPIDATWAELEPLLDEALEELPLPMKSVIIARFFEGRTQQEIAMHQGISQSTVSRALEQGIAELRSKLKARGVACGAGLATLLAAHGGQAAPPALSITLGKLALAGVGAATATLTLTQIITSILMTPAAKLTLAAAAVLAVAAIGNDLASGDSTVRRLFANDSATQILGQSRASSPFKVTPAIRPASPHAPVAAGTSAIALPKAPQSAGGPQARTIKAPSPVMLAKLSRVATEEAFKAFILRVFSLRDPGLMAAEIERTLGLSLTAKELAGRVFNPAVLEVAIFGNMAARHPEEMLAWMSMYEGNTRMMSSAALTLVLKNHPHLTAGSVEAILPAGPNREVVLSVLRAQHDPFSEAAKVISGARDERTRLDRLWQLADLWPKDRLAEGAGWALQNLEGQQLHAALPRLAHHLSVASPDDAVALLARITDTDLLARTLVDTMHGLVQLQPRMADVVQVIDRLQGQQRSYAIAELGRRWVRVDQEGLMQWIDNLESAADFEAALPLTLPQLSPENYTKAMNTLMTQLDGTLDAALIKAAMPELSNSTHTTIDIIQRLTRLPQYQSICSGQRGNADLLWVAVNRAAEGWVKTQGARPQDGAQWIDSLPFRTQADKAAVAGKLYEQWKLSDPSSAAQWAARAGVTLR